VQKYKRLSIGKGLKLTNAEPLFPMIFRCSPSEGLRVSVHAAAPSSRHGEALSRVPDAQGPGEELSCDYLALVATPAGIASGSDKVYFLLPGLTHSSV
jgi:hypothetical protein